MSKKQKHTPLPWKVALLGELIVGPSERVIAACAFLADGVGGPDEITANAKFIVRACNSHYQLVEALKNLYMEIRGYNPTDIDLTEAEVVLLAAGVEL